MKENSPETNKDAPKSKEELEKALKELQIDPEDLDAVVGGLKNNNEACDTCYSKYT